MKWIKSAHREEYLAEGATRHTFVWTDNKAEAFRFTDMEATAVAAEAFENNEGVEIVDAEF